MKRRNLNEWIEDYQAGKFVEESRDNQIEAGWYDWFCKESSLVNKTKKLGKKILQIKDSKKFDNEKVYVFFKNNYPCYGDWKLYDDFRICDIETGDVLFTVIPRNPYGKAEVWGIENDFKKSLITGDWKEIKDWFLK